MDGSNIEEEKNYQQYRTTIWFCGGQTDKYPTGAAARIELGLLGGCWLLALALALRCSESCCPATKYAMSINRRAGGGSHPSLWEPTPTTAKPDLMGSCKARPAHFVI